MAYWREKNGRKYMYDQNNVYVKALGYIDDKKADRECLDWEIDHGRRPQETSKRSMKVIFEEYIAWAIRERFTPKSIHSMRAAIEPFLETVPYLGDLTKGKIKAWADYLKTATFKKGPKGQERRLANDTIAHRLRTIQAFCSWMADSDLHNDHPIIEDSPFRIKIPKQRKDAGRALEPTEVHGLFEHWPVPTRVEFRPSAELAKLFFQIVYHGGTRITEVLGDPDMPEDYPGLQGEHVDVEGCTIKLFGTKDGESREVALPESIVRLIPTTPGPVFRGKITATMLNWYRRRAAINAGIKGRLRDYDGRVTCATHWAEVNPSPVPKDMMDQFGWKSVAMAAHYQKVSKAKRVKKAQNMVYGLPVEAVLKVL